MANWEIASDRFWIYIVQLFLAIASFGTDANNELYVCAFDGKIYKFEEN